MATELECCHNTYVTASGLALYMCQVVGCFCSVLNPNACMFELCPYI